MFYKVGIDFFPLEKLKIFRDMKLTAEFFQLYKVKPQGGISDYDASSKSHDIGYEIDHTLK